MVEDKDDEIHRLQAYKDACMEMASHRKGGVDDYIRIAKQAVQDYETGYKKPRYRSSGFAAKRRLAASRFEEGGDDR